jgi:hypothetical protein
MSGPEESRPKDVSRLYAGFDAGYSFECSSAEQERLVSRREKMEQKDMKNTLLWGLAIAVSGVVSPLSAQTTRYYEVSISPTSVAAGSITTFTMVFTNCNSDNLSLCGGVGTTNNGNGEQAIKSATVTVPTGFSAVSSLSVSATGGKTWTASLTGTTITLGFPNATNKISPGESLTLTFNATAPPCSQPAAAYQWTTAAYHDTQNATAFTRVGAQPSVSVTTGNCPDPGALPLAGYCSFSQGGWGSDPHGNNPGQLLSSLFVAQYGTGGVKVGNTANWMQFTSASGVDAYLPAGNTPGTLSMQYTNPTSTSSGVFGGQVLALRLNLDLGLKIPGAVHGMGPLILTGTGTSLDGQTVSQILAAAEAALGGGSLPAGYSISLLNDLVDQLNNAFDGCVTSVWASEHLRQ